MDEEKGFVWTLIVCALVLSALVYWATKGTPSDASAGELSVGASE